MAENTDIKKPMLAFSGATYCGQREKNQDCILADGFISDPGSAEPQIHSSDGAVECGDTLKLFAVCDGVGMFRLSGYAASYVLSSISEFVDEYNVCGDKPLLEDWLCSVLDKSKEALIDFCSECNMEASTTVAMLAIKGTEYCFVNLGDSPAFVLHADGGFEELSVRHNLAQLKILNGVEPNPGDERMLIHHLLGDGELPSDVCNVASGNIAPGDAFLICTDGVSGAFTEETVKQYLSEKKTAEELAEPAAQIEGADNCSAITIYVVEEEG